MDEYYQRKNEPTSTRFIHFIQDIWPSIYRTINGLLLGIWRFIGDTISGLWRRY